MERDTRLFTVYKRVEPYLYGAISVVVAEAVAQGGTIPLGASAGQPTCGAPNRLSRHQDAGTSHSASCVELQNPDCSAACKQLCKVEARVPYLLCPLPTGS